MAINLPKFALISQIFFKILSIFGVFNIFLPNVTRLGYMLYGFFKELKPIAVISVTKVTFGSISGLNEAKIDQKIAENYICFQ